VVVNAPTPELAREARDALINVLLPKHEVFRSVRAPDGGAFFEQNFLLYLSTEELARTAQELTTAAPLIRTLASDPSVRGVLDALNLSVRGVQMGRVSLNDLARTLDMGAEPIEDVLPASSVLDTAKEKPVEGEVLAVGRGAHDETGRHVPLDVKVGDRVLFGKWAGAEVLIDGEEQLILKEGDILGVTEGKTRAAAKAA
jgi:chaperonin GroES